MERKGTSLLVCFVLLGLVSQSFIAPISARKLDEFSDKKSYFPPSTPHYKPTPSYPTPSYGSPSTPTPTYGSPSTPTPTYGSPPSGGYGSAPSGGGYTPPYTPTKSYGGTCDYWKKHEDKIKTLIGYWGTISQFFGPGCGAILGGNASLLDALKNKRTDGFGALLREGTAAYLNSIASKKYPFNTQQVKECFAASVISDGAAAAQADLFKKANEGMF